MNLAAKTLNDLETAEKLWMDCAKEKDHVNTESTEHEV